MDEWEKNAPEREENWTANMRMVDDFKVQNVFSEKDFFINTVPQKLACEQQQGCSRGGGSPRPPKYND